MKQCEETRAQIAFYLDDEIKGDELAEFEAHLDACADCRRACEDERRFLALVRARARSMSRRLRSALASSRLYQTRPRLTPPRPSSGGA